MIFMMIFFSIELGPRLCNSTHLEVLVVGGAQLEGVEFEIHRNEGDAAFAHEIKLWAPENIILQASLPTYSDSAGTAIK